MKKLVITTSLLLLTSLTVLNAKSVYTDEYQLHSDIYNKSIDITNATKKEIFFGLKDDYFENFDKYNVMSNGAMGTISGISSQAGNLAAGAFETGLKGVGAGLGAGLIIGIIDNKIKEGKKAAEWIYIVDFTNEKGETTRGSALLSSQFKDFKAEPKLEKIKEIMKKGF